MTNAVVNSIQEFVAIGEYAVSRAKKCGGKFRFRAMDCGDMLPGYHNVVMATGALYEKESVVMSAPSQLISTMNVLDLEGFERFLKLIKLEVKTYRGYRIVERTFTEGIAERAVDAIEDGTIPEEDKAIFRSLIINVLPIGGNAVAEINFRTMGGKIDKQNLTFSMSFAFFNLLVKSMGNNPILMMYIKHELHHVKQIMEDRLIYSAPYYLFEGERVTMDLIADFNSKIEIEARAAAGIYMVENGHQGYFEGADIFNLTADESTAALLKESMKHYQL